MASVANKVVQPGCDGCLCSERQFGEGGEATCRYVELAKLAGYCRFREDELPVELRHDPSPVARKLQLKKKGS